MFTTVVNTFFYKIFLKVQNMSKRIRYHLKHFKKYTSDSDRNTFFQTKLPEKTTESFKDFVIRFQNFTCATYKDLGIILGLSPSTICLLLLDKRHVTGEMIRKLGEHFNLSAACIKKMLQIEGEKRREEALEKFKKEL